MESLETLRGFLVFVLTPAGTGVAVYFIVQEVPYFRTWFRQRVAELKRLIVLGLSLLLPLAAAGLAMYLGYLPADEQTIYTALAVGVEAFTISQLIHGFIDLRSKRLAGQARSRGYPYRNGR